MMTTTAYPQGLHDRRNLFGIISRTALLAGALDIFSAIVKFYLETGRGPQRIFQYIASAIFGPEAYTGGTLMIVWGLVFHFMIAFLFTLVLFPLYPVVYRWIRNRWLIAVFYGLITWSVMNLVVVPLSRVKTGPFHPQQAVIAAVILICMIGLPIALIAHRYYISYDSNGRKTP